MSGTRISVIMITGNVLSMSPGRAIFERVLQAVSWADELIIVDSDSQDGTREVAARYTGRIYVHPYAGSLKQQKVIALGYATGDWILQVDADELLPPALVAEIQAAVAAPAAQGYRIRRQHYFAGAFLEHAGEDAPFRLWRAGVGQWIGSENDDTYDVPAPVACFAHPMQHFSSPSLAARLRKIVYFAPPEADREPLPLEGAYGYRQLWRLVVRPGVQRFYGVFWVERGFRDGVRGAVWAMLCAIQVFMIKALVWERAQAPGPDPAPAPRPPR